VSYSRAVSCFTLYIFLLAAASLSFAQDTNSSNIGLPPNGVFSGSDVETVQVNNGNLHIEIPLYSVPGRGLNTSVKYVYDSRGWIAKMDHIHHAPTTPGPHNNLQWAVVAPLSRAGVKPSDVFAPTVYGVYAGYATCPTGLDVYYTYINVTVYEPNGTSHYMGQAIPSQKCYPSGLTPNAYAQDGSGFQVIYNWANFSGCGLSLQGCPINAQVISPDGTQLFPVISGGIVTQYVLRDRNGNQITRAWTSGAGMADNLTDTLGRTLNVNPVLNTSTGNYELTYYDTSGTAQKIIITNSPVTINALITPANCDAFDPPCTTSAYVTTWQMPTQILFLNSGVTYSITYNQNGFGTPSSITLPTGAVISYTYRPDPDTGENTLVASRTVTSGGQTAIWNYTASTVTDPLGNETVNTFTGGGASGLPAQLVEADTYFGTHTSGTLLKKVQTDYFSEFNSLPIHETTTWPQQGNLQSHVEMDYDVFTCGGGCSLYSYGAITEKREYNFGVGNYGALARRTHYDYAHISGNTGYNANYSSLNLLRLNTKKVVYDGSNNILAQSTTTYDGTAVTGTSGVPGHDNTNYTSAFNYRGNPTQSSVWRNLPSVLWLPTNNTYNDLGHVLSTQDPGLHTTTFSYVDSWASGAATCGLGTNTLAYLTQTTAPDTVNSQATTVHHRTQTSYFPCTGQKQSARDENDILAARTGTQYSYNDSLLRLTSALRKDSGAAITSETDYSYVDTANAVSVTTTTRQTPTTSIVSTSYHDGLGRVKQTKLIDSNDGDTMVDTTYDLLSRVATVSNPYRGSPCTPITTCETQYQYDALGRKVLEIPPDGTPTSNNVVTAYSSQTTAPLGLTVTVTDQASKRHMSVSDALGRLADLWEPSAISNSLVNETLYTYDLLNNLLRVDQKGGTTNPSLWRTRTFTYDSLSRLLTARNPESGLITWTYDNDSNVLTKVDARNTITYNYDQLHRVATVGTTHAKVYSNGDHAVDYFFDQTSYNGLAITEGVHHQTGMADATGSSASTFDSEGRPVSENQTISITGVTTTAVTKALSYAYNMDSSLQSITYPGPHTVNYLYNNAGHALSAIDSSIPNKYVTSATYAPHGDVASYINGFSSSFAGIQTTNAWNNRFQPQSFVAATLGTGAHNVMSLAFNFNQGTAGAPIDNGMLVKITNNVNTGRSTNYSYDQLNRIIAGWHDATDWGTQYTLDIWGNLSQKAPCNNTVGCPTHTTGESLSVGINGNNQFVGYSYDASGNLQSDQQLPNHTFVYDAENRPSSESTSSATVSYYYNGEGERVAKSSGKLYWFGTNSSPLLETDATGATTAQYIFFNGKRVAMRKPDNSAHYYFADQIGSANIVTNATGTVEQDIEYHPYGEQQVYTDTSGQEYRFTGHEHDPETNNDYFGARYYSSTFGRFLTADWSATPVPIPYAVIGNPQTLNLYAYVENNPITGTDPDGHAGNYIGDGAGYYECLQQGNCDETTNSPAPPPPPASPPPPPAASAEANANDKATPGPAQSAGQISLTLGDTKVTGTYSFGETGELGPNGVALGAVIHATADCTNCTWIQTVESRTHELTTDVPSTQKDHLDDKQNSPLYNAKDKNNFYDTPYIGGIRIVTGASGFNTMLGIADAKNRTFHIIGAMSWAYSVTTSGRVIGFAPAVATATQLRNSITVLSREFSAWKFD
jgi:RHS repeat-associated protein